MNSPHLTIVMPTLDSARTLRAALDSVVGQRYHDLELLIVDSVSTDKTLEIAGTYVGRDARIRIISERDRGIYDAMNKGVAQARGEWIFFLGSDDRLYDDSVLEKIFSRPGVEEVDLVYGNVVSPGFPGAYDGPFDYEKLLRRNMPHQAIFYKKRLFTLVGNYNLGYRGHADWDLNIRCFADDRLRIRYVDLVIACFGAEGVSSRHDQPFLREVMIPARLQRLSIHPDKRLSVQAYDDWWRVLRNAGIRDRDTLNRLAGQKPVPHQVFAMLDWQRKLPVGLLRKGVFSKFFMVLSYIFNH
jgi:glycosyltransferase involved in cell wall biosynthesis